jgi:hypothetical protein
MQFLLDHGAKVDDPDEGQYATHGRHSKWRQLGPAGRPCRRRQAAPRQGASVNAADKALHITGPPLGRLPWRHASITLLLAHGADGCAHPARPLRTHERLRTQGKSPRRTPSSPLRNDRSPNWPRRSRPGLILELMGPSRKAAWSLRLLAATGATYRISLPFWSRGLRSAEAPALLTRQARRDFTRASSALRLDPPPSLPSGCVVPAPHPPRVNSPVTSFLYPLPTISLALRRALRSSECVSCCV